MPAPALPPTAPSACRANTAIILLLALCAGEVVTPAAAGPAAAAYPTPPTLSALPDTPFGAAIRHGHAIFTDTHNGAAAYVGNDLNCTNCHLDAGRQANAAPLWGAWPAYPEYRKKNHRVNTFEDRLRDCFRFSLNGKPPPAGSAVIADLESYASWLARGLPTGVSPAGRGYPRLAEPSQTPEYARGKVVYAQSCAACHMLTGAGLKTAGHTEFPPLWGRDSFNWGAGMANVDVAARFIHANMPYGRGNTLSVQQAWDVALYVDSHDRPQDPRYIASVAETRQKFHASPYSMYGRRVNGRLLGGDTNGAPQP
ncbi:MAG: c-type cytochrome [Nevskiaceae bacterium]|nr:MAG: c-type cytochrome [Nevskiaceae bacterium]TBR74149.1 MAG: c-type cytochrome [Nevskiaceae bacterium]